MRSTLATALARNLSKPDETRSFDKGKFDIITIEGNTLGRAVFEPGWKWSESVKPIVNTPSCEASHFGYVISGQMTIVMNDGKTLHLKPGDVVAIPPGHDAWTEGREPCVFLDFTAAEYYAKR